MKPPQIDASSAAWAEVLATFLEYDLMLHKHGPAHTETAHVRREHILALRHYLLVTPTLRDDGSH